MAFETDTLKALGVRFNIPVMEIKEITVDPNALVVMVRSMSTKGSITDCVKEGAKNDILKPFEEAKVIEVIQKVLS
ncbi:MAG TPA: hypothetical protein VI382_10650 [Candidatus Manganitrophaceae bacterium]|nr:hypothetical protein [Candidatus Manganitrophaceae bacterium]